MKKQINTNPESFKDLELLDTDITNNELIERLNVLTEYVNFLYKGHMGIN